MWDRIPILTHGSHSPERYWTPFSRGILPATRERREAVRSNAERWNEV